MKNIIVVIAAVLMVSTAAWASPVGLGSFTPLNSFTGPVSPYYVTNVSNQTIQVIQGTNFSSFNMAYGGPRFGFSESVIAVTDTVRTRSYNQGSGGSGGQYSLAGSPSGTMYADPTPSALQYDYAYDGASDGQHNYYVQYFGVDGNSNYTEDVYQTGLDWQNPTKLFSVQSSAGTCCEFLGITYDGANNSLWISGWAKQSIADYTLGGTLLSSFVPASNGMGALGFDPADQTLWMVRAGGNELLQYSTTGTLLQDGVLTDMPFSASYGGEFAQGSAVPEQRRCSWRVAVCWRFSAVSNRSKRANPSDLHKCRCQCRWRGRWRGGPRLGRRLPLAGGPVGFRFARRWAD